MKRFTLSLCLLALLASPLQAAKFKKWVDEEGVVHYGTTVPPQYINKEHTELNQEGIAVEHTGRARTAAEIAQDKEIKRLRAEQQKLLHEQKAEDRMLLNLYRSEDDLILVRDGKLAQLDAQIRVKKQEIERLKQRLSKLQNRAADLERRGRRLDKNTSLDMESTQRQIEDSYAGILQREDQKQKLAQRYNADLARFRQLKKIDKERAVRSGAANQQDVVIDTAVPCNEQDCDALWRKATDYARRHATTSVEVAGPRILMTSSPREANDIAITVSRIAADKTGGERIFLDVQCATSVTAQAFCRGEKVTNIRRNFRAAVQP